MKFLLVLSVLSAASFSVCQSQSITIDLGNNHNRRFVTRYVVEAANHDPSADTPEKIFRANEALAKDGDTGAAWQLALSYLQGYGTKQDLAQAERWFQIGATDPSQKALVGQMYRNGDYFSLNLAAAARWLIAAGRPGDLFELAQAYRTASPPQIQKATNIYLTLLKQKGHPEVRRAQMELGNFVLDLKYTAGDNPSGRALNLEWARIITQELLGQEEYKIAVDYEIGREDLPADKNMWLHFCKRAAAYNIDLAQSFYAQAIAEGNAPNNSGYDEVAWTRLASNKQSGQLVMLKAMESGMTSQHEAANVAYDSLVQTRNRTGAYYPQGDPLRSLSPVTLERMPQDDPDVQLRRAFMLEKAALTDKNEYLQAMNIYRTVRDHRESDIRFVLGRNSLNGTNGIPKNETAARYWLQEASNRGSEPARLLLKKLESH